MSEEQTPAENEQQEKERQEKEFREANERIVRDIPIYTV